MTANLAVEHARQRLGRVGLGFAFAGPSAPASAWRDAAVRAEQAGFGSIWTNEGIGGGEAFTRLSLMLEATETIVAGPAVANIWARHPAVMQAAAATLADAHPGRFVLGVGVSHRFVVEASGQTFPASPVTAQREYLETMRASADSTVRPEIPFPTIVGALGPRMLELSRDHADGALPSSLPVAHTKQTRDHLGPDKLLVVGVSAILDPDPESARVTARSSPLFTMPDSPQQRSLAALGYSRADLADGGTDEVVDAAFAHGDAEAVAARIGEHLDAGADHVIVYGNFGASLAEQARVIEQLGPALRN
ncbi:TIGR03620 family F420-dependent LLM class oxidoreductase [Amycolatopsis suaedae]|uniref:TIGR03620 family F420-dependent LLM class oxidoreductase n=1 Tax=Amycolatopsis suaedae TaxID=2510978 RepID=A0A4Q7IZL5_9PSEU|nr:TIGR03620 family F420-dependent LLM class oxidoreductase [Amycolatopsis suaedae]RZQ59546.1 TIGR03620 family F420-dependent LLM class oxidoreductase [Amycolatopsis suaedae]